MTMRDKLLAFAEAVSAAFPNDPPRDRYGRVHSGIGDGEPLRLLACKLQEAGFHVGPAYDRQEQVGRVARALLKCASDCGLAVNINRK